MTFPADPMDGILGQPAPVHFLKRLQQLDKYPRALLFHGPPGVGKLHSAMAYALSINMVGDPAKDQRTYDLVQAGEHPDIKVWRLPAGETTIKIDTVREFIEEARQPKFEAPRRRVLVMGDIQGFPSHRQADALLKTLEDGLGDTTFICTATSMDGVFKTLRSRMLPVRFQPLDPLTMQALLAPAYGDNPDLGIAIGLSGGSLDKAHQFMEPPGEGGWTGREMRSRGVKLLKSLQRTPVHVLVKFMKAVPSQGDGTLTFLGVLESILVDVVKAEEGLFDSVQNSDIIGDIVAIAGMYQNPLGMLFSVQKTLGVLKASPGLLAQHHATAMVLGLGEAGR